MNCDTVLDLKVLLNFTWYHPSAQDPMSQNPLKIKRSCFGLLSKMYNWKGLWRSWDLLPYFIQLRNLKLHKMEETFIFVTQAFLLLANEKIMQAVTADQGLCFFGVSYQVLPCTTIPPQKEIFRIKEVSWALQRY